MLQIISGAISLGLIWAIMTIGVLHYLPYFGYHRSDGVGSIAMGAAIAAQAITNGANPISQPFLPCWGLAAGLAGDFCTRGSKYQPSCRAF